MTSEKSSQPPNPFAGSEVLQEFWKKSVEQCTEQMQTLMGAFKVDNDPQNLRRLWLDSLAQNLDLYMRSPLFLETMKQNLDTWTRGKDEAKGKEPSSEGKGSTSPPEETKSGPPSPNPDQPSLPDLAVFLKILQAGQEVILSRLIAIENRLGDIESRLAKIEKPPAKIEKPPAKTEKPPAKTENPSGKAKKSPAKPRKKQEE